MTADGVICDLSTKQSPSGAFLSMVRHGGEWLDDENGFITALVIREMAGLSAPTDTRARIERGLDFLEGCQSESRPGAFHFYPPGREPEWMGARLAPDADDTALYAVELLRHGRMTRTEARRIIEDVLEPHRLHYRPELMPPWVRQGAYRTWLETSRASNPVDCCVNANVAALIKYAGMADHPGYAAACKTVINGVRWAACSEQHARLLTPYYSHPAELLHAMRRAIDAGVEEFREPLDLYARNRWVDADAEDRPLSHRPVCCSPDGSIFWVAPVLQLARRAFVHASITPRTETRFAEGTTNA